MDNFGKKYIERFMAEPQRRIKVANAMVKV